MRALGWGVFYFLSLYAYKKLYILLLFTYYILPNLPNLILVKPNGSKGLTGLGIGLGLKFLPNIKRLKRCYYRFSVSKIPNLIIFQLNQSPKHH